MLHDDRHRGALGAERHLLGIIEDFEPNMPRAARTDRDATRADGVTSGEGQHDRDLGVVVAGVEGRGPSWLVVSGARAVLRSGMWPTAIAPCSAPMWCIPGALPPAAGKLTATERVKARPPIIVALAALPAPVVAVNPEVSRTGAESLRRHGVEPITLNGVGHSSMLEDPDQFDPVLVAALASFFG